MTPLRNLCLAFGLLPLGFWPMLKWEQPPMFSAESGGSVCLSSSSSSSDLSDDLHIAGALQARNCNLMD
ncbi:hypothetical protein Nepgr_021380 [Nepenthes gracilis]|uniref:Uncharacterized protein n=1 Tax=Nepenthes gracilis TaxID=150966 RepID=A0AAD3SYJ2_NEPGR|nr:hypothetical protein Nepgr_021380 [Nepenthes gracilis]